MQGKNFTAKAPKALKGREEKAALDASRVGSVSFARPILL
jgi:hypothetical protein